MPNIKHYYFCAYCGNWCKLTKDHVVSKWYLKKIKYQFNNPEHNLLLVCRLCNYSKANLPLDIWLLLLPPDAPQQLYARRFLCMDVWGIHTFYKAQLVVSFKNKK